MCIRDSSLSLCVGAAAGPPRAIWLDGRSAPHQVHADVVRRVDDTIDHCLRGIIARSCGASAKASGAEAVAHSPPGTCAPDHPSANNLNVFRPWSRITPQLRQNLRAGPWALRNTFAQFCNSGART
eukprot:3309781-Pyramimonas_sp.AAC.1